MTNLNAIKSQYANTTDEGLAVDLYFEIAGIVGDAAAWLKEQGLPSLNEKFSCPKAAANDDLASGEFHMINPVVDGDEADDDRCNVVVARYVRGFYDADDISNPHFEVIRVITTCDSWEDAQEYIENI